MIKRDEKGGLSNRPKGEDVQNGPFGDFDFIVHHLYIYHHHLYQWLMVKGLGLYWVDMLFSRDCQASNSALISQILINIIISFFNFIQFYPILSRVISAKLEGLAIPTE